MELTNSLEGPIGNRPVALNNVANFETDCMKHQVFPTMTRHLFLWGGSRI